MSSSPETVPQPTGGPGTPAGTREGGIPPNLRTAAVFAADLLAVVVFVLLGRSSHGENEALHGVLITLWPFLSGMLVGWLAMLVAGMRATSYPAGLVLMLGTVAVGMLLRRAVSHDGTPVSFVIAASTFLTLFFLGWRGAAHLIGRRLAG
jgi:hypothetical protein